jgi:hypothetical protein
MKLLALCLFIVCVRSQGWTMIWNDEFDGTTLNTTKWQNEVDCWGGGNGELQCYTSRPQNIKVTNGNLVLTAIPGTYTVNKQENFFSNFFLGIRCWMYK